MHKKACIIGDPVAHSRSPMIHNHWLKQLGIDGLYDHAHVAPEQLPSFVGKMQSMGYVGANCTIPHKETVIKLCNHISDTAKALGAVNTIWFENNQIYGDNTDVEGFLGALDYNANGWDKDLKKAVVIGAGGAARAVIYGLIQSGVKQIYCVNRSMERAQSLANQFGAQIIPISLYNMPLALQDTRLLINTTSLGMKGQPPLTIDLSPLHPDAVVNDIVYVPLETSLFKAAHDRNLKSVSGLDMLLFQAVSGFERWFGTRPKVTDELRQLLQKDIET